MLSWLTRIVMACWKPVRQYARMSKDGTLNDDDDSAIPDSLFWSRDLEKHSFGEFSFAMVQANEVIEDHSQVETGRDATFIGVYDGHGEGGRSQAREVRVRETGPVTEVRRDVWAILCRRCQMLLHLRLCRYFWVGSTVKNWDPV